MSIPKIGVFRNLLGWQAKPLFLPGRPPAQTANSDRGTRNSPNLMRRISFAFIPQSEFRIEWWLMPRMSPWPDTKGKPRMAERFSSNQIPEDPEIMSLWVLVRGSRWVQKGHYPNCLSLPRTPKSKGRIIFDSASVFIC